MKNLISIVFLLLSFNAFTQHITSDQLYLFPEAGWESWDVGEFKYFPADTGLNGACTYTWTVLSGNEEGAFSVNSSTGRITIADSTQFYGEGSQDYNLLIKITTSTGRSDTNYAKIHIHDEDSCIFLDPTWGGTESGTIAEPYDNWMGDIGATPVYGYAYFLKAGTTCQSGDYLRVQTQTGGSESKPIRIGKYGTSTSVFKFTSSPGLSTNGAVIGTSVTGDTLNPTDWVYLYHIRSEYYDESGFECWYLGRSSRDLYFNYCEGYQSGSPSDGEFYMEGFIHQDENINFNFCYANSGSSLCHGWKCVKWGVKLIGCYGNNAGNNNIFDLVTSWVNNADRVVYGCYGKGNASYGVYLRTRENEVSYSYLDGTGGLYRCLNADSLGVYENTTNSNIHHCKFRGGASNPTVMFRCADSVYFTDNTIIGNTSQTALLVAGTSGDPGDNRNLFIRRNKIYNGGSDGINITNYDNQKIYIENNLIYNNTGDGIQSDITSCYVRGNTIVKNSGYDVNNNSGGSVEFRSNIYESTTGTLSPSSNNYDNDGGDVFTDYTNNDFTIADSTQPVVDAGYDYGQLTDILGNEVSTSPDSLVDKWDIGAYEFIWGVGLTEPTSDNWDTLKINLTQTGYLAPDWNNMITLSQYDSIQLTAEDDTLTNSYLVIMQDSLNLSGTLGNYPIDNYTAPQNAAEQNWWWGGLDSQVFKISNVPAGYYNITVYGSKSGSSQDLDVEASVGAKSVTYNAADNDSVYVITQVNHTGGNMNIIFDHVTDGSHLNFIVIEKTTYEESPYKMYILQKAYINGNAQGYIRKANGKYFYFKIGE